MIIAGVLPMPIVFCLRRFQILKVDLDIHQGSIRRNETTASTKVMMDDDDVSIFYSFWVYLIYGTFGVYKIKRANITLDNLLSISQSE